MLLRTWQNLSLLAKRSLKWCGSSFIQSTSSHIPLRAFAVSSVRNLKEIKEVTEGNVTKIEGCTIPSERTNYVVPKEGTGCTLCKIHPYLKYTDVLILSQFLRPDGCLLPHYVTGVCRSQQFRLQRLVTQAQRAGLLPQFRPELKNGRKRTNHHSNYKWKRYNVYFKE